MLNLVSLRGQAMEFVTCFHYAEALLAAIHYEFQTWGAGGWCLRPRTPTGCARLILQPTSRAGPVSRT